MGKAGEFLAATYPDVDHAKVTLDMLEQMHRAATITLIDAAMITKDEKGKYKVHETDEMTAKKGAIRGAVVTGVLGLIYPPSFIASVIAGGGIGALMGRMRDTGIKHDKIQEIADKLEPGKAAVIALVEGEFGPQVQQALEGYEGTMVVQVVDEATLKAIYEAKSSGNY